MSDNEFFNRVSGMRGALSILAKRFTSNREELSDLVQDTILKALVSKNRYYTDNNLKGWLFTIMRNTFINNCRRGRPRSGSLHEIETVTLSLRDDHTFSSPDAAFYYHEILDKVNKLRQDLLIPFNMYRMGYKYDQIAGHLGMPIGTVKSKIFNARKEIQRRLVD